MIPHCRSRKLPFDFFDTFMLYLIGVQQGLRVLDQPAHGQSELPGEVGGVPHPRAHSLPHEGRREVSRVPGYERPPPPPPLGHFGLELQGHRISKDYHWGLVVLEFHFLPELELVSELQITLIPNPDLDPALEP